MDSILDKTERWLILCRLVDIFLDAHSKMKGWWLKKNGMRETAKSIKNSGSWPKNQLKFDIQINQQLFYVDKLWEVPFSSFKPPPLVFSSFDYANLTANSFRSKHMKKFFFLIPNIMNNN